MKRKGMPTARLLMSAWICWIAGASTGAALPPSPSEAATAAPGTLTATVRAVDLRGGTLDVVTGVGHALRVLRMRVDPACQIRVERAEAGLGDLRAGEIVRIRYRKTADLMVAEAIEALRSREEGREP